MALYFGLYGSAHRIQWLKTAGILNTVTVAGVMLQTSRPKRKNFINELAIYVGGEKG